MNKISEYLLMILPIMLCRCEIDSPSLPSLDQQTFSYDQMMQKKKQLEEEMQEISPQLQR